MKLFHDLLMIPESENAPAALSSLWLAVSELALPIKFKS